MLLGETAPLCTHEGLALLFPWGPGAQKIVTVSAEAPGPHTRNPVYPVSGNTTTAEV
jgi:hypothetical protein